MRLMHRILLLLAPLVISLPSMAGAQTYSTVETGSRVRLWIADANPPVTGKVISQNTTTLRVQVDGGSVTVFKRDDVNRMDLGRHRSRAATAAWGTLIGGATGFVLGYIQGDDKAGPMKLDAGSKGVLLGILGLPTGLLTGLVIGPGAEHWTEVTSSRPTMQLAPSVTLKSIGVKGAVRW